ncbi:MAG: imelysin family protein [Bacteroidia bacterium]
MTNIIGFKISFAVLALSFIASCGGSDNGAVNDGYNREVLLQEYSTWIQDQYATVQNSIAELKTTALDFTQTPDSSSLKALKTAYLNAYTAWQWVDFLNIEGAMEQNLVESANTFPCDTSLIEKNINDANGNLDPINQYVAQGFPALDYLLFSSKSTETISAFKDQNRANYLNLLINRLESKCTQVVNTWSSTEQAFITDSGSDAGSSIATMFNSMLKSFERRTRDAKVGIPAGVRTDNEIQPEQVEALYSGQNLKLAKENVIAFKSFFNCSEIDGFDNYLSYLESERNGTPLATVINDQFDHILKALNAIDTDIKTSVEKDKSVAINAFNEMQKLIIYIKVDMSAELGILINYADNDGDS